MTRAARRVIEMRDNPYWAASYCEVEQNCVHGLILIKSHYNNIGVTRYYM